MNQEYILKIEHLNLILKSLLRTCNKEYRMVTSEIYCNKSITLKISNPLGLQTNKNKIKESNF